MTELESSASAAGRNIREHLATVYCLTHWEFYIDQKMRLEDKDGKEWLYNEIQNERKNFSKIQHLVHSDLDYLERFNELIKKSEELLK